MDAEADVEARFDTADAEDDLYDIEDFEEEEDAVAGNAQITENGDHDNGHRNAGNDDLGGGISDDKGTESAAEGASGRLEDAVHSGELDQDGDVAAENPASIENTAAVAQLKSSSADSMGEASTALSEEANEPVAGPFDSSTTGENLPSDAPAEDSVDEQAAYEDEGFENSMAESATLELDTQSASQLDTEFGKKETTNPSGEDTAAAVAANDGVSANPTVAQAAPTSTVDTALESVIQPGTHERQQDEPVGVAEKEQQKEGIPQNSGRSSKGAKSARSQDEQQTATTSTTATNQQPKSTNKPSSDNTPNQGEPIHGPAQRHPYKQGKSSDRAKPAKATNSVGTRETTKPKPVQEALKTTRSVGNHQQRSRDRGTENGALESKTKSSNQNDRPDTRPKVSTQAPQARPKTEDPSEQKRKHTPERAGKQERPHTLDGSSRQKPQKEHFPSGSRSVTSMGSVSDAAFNEWCQRKAREQRERKEKQAQLDEQLRQQMLELRQEKRKKLASRRSTTKKRRSAGLHHPKLDYVLAEIAFSPYRVRPGDPYRQTQMKFLQKVRRMHYSVDHPEPEMLAPKPVSPMMSVASSVRSSRGRRDDSSTQLSRSGGLEERSQDRVVEKHLPEVLVKKCREDVQEVLQYRPNFEHPNAKRMSVPLRVQMQVPTTRPKSSSSVSRVQALDWGDDGDDPNQPERFTAIKMHSDEESAPAHTPTVTFCLEGEGDPNISNTNASPVNTSPTHHPQGETAMPEEDDYSDEKFDQPESSAEFHSTAIPT